METGNRVCAVIVTYNRRDKLRKCIECLLHQERATCDILIVNNASTDGTEEMIRKLYSVPQVHYYNTGKNLGGAGGFEFGIKEAVIKGFEYVWIMDDDTWPDKDALAELLDAGKELNNEWGFLSSVAYWTDGTICRMNIQKKGILKHIGKDEYSRDISEVRMCSFVSLLVKSDVVKELGLPIGDYFIWTDDYEFTGRISRKYKCYMVTKSHVVHAMERHTRVNFATDDSDRLDRYRYIYRNDVHCYRQYGLKGWMYIILKDCYTMLNILLHSKVKWKKIRVMINGVKDGIHYSPDINRV